MFRFGSISGLVFSARLSREGSSAGDSHGHQDVERNTAFGEIKVTKAQIDAFGKALGQYCLDVGRYPSTEQVLGALISPASNRFLPLPSRCISRSRPLLPMEASATRFIRGMPTRSVSDCRMPATRSCRWARTGRAGCSRHASIRANGHWFFATSCTPC